MGDDATIRHESVEANGLEFHVAAAGHGERLALLLHGFPESWYSWRHQLPLLARLGYKAWAPDLRGYGATERPPNLQDYAVERLLEDVAGLIDAAGARETFLVGHDWGAAIAWYFAMRKPRPLERLAIMNVPHPAVLERSLRKWSQLRRSWYVLFFQLPWLPEKLLGARGARAVGEAIRRSAVDQSRFPDEVIAVYREAASRPGALTAMLNYYRAMVRGGGARRQRRLGTLVIDVPTLMIWGEEDVALAKHTTYGTDAYVRDLTLRTLPGVSHWVQQEAPEVVNAMLEAWLRGAPVPQADAVTPERRSRDASSSGLERGGERRMPAKVVKSDAEWREQLSAQQYEVCRRSATEPAFSGAYTDCKDEGVYRCVCCGNELFRSAAKYDSGTGWPSFFEPVSSDSVRTEIDRSRGMVRTEVRCAACDAHLGHAFPDGPAPSGQRYCMNSLALDLARKGER